MMNLAYDLHIHSCLSPCGDGDMTPANIAGMAALKGLDIVALTDHNTCRNCPAFMAAAAEYGLLAVPGMEINTSEEVHAVCLFPALEKALDFDTYVYDRLIKFPDVYKRQQEIRHCHFVERRQCLLDNKVYDKGQDHHGQGGQGPYQN